MDYEQQRDRGSSQHTMRGHFGGLPPLLHRDRKYDERSYGGQNSSAGHHHTSPREKTDREKRMEKFMLAGDFYYLCSLFS